jgi:hypothetical protein
MLTSYKQRRASASMVPYPTILQDIPGLRVQVRAPVMVALCSAPRAPPRLTHLPRSRYEKCFSQCLFVK